MNFFFWHYTNGLKIFLEIWKNYFEFFWNFFSVGRFSKTLFSAWRRDISRISRRGLHPLLFLRALAENIITRILGAIVRSAVIIIGIAIEAGTLIFGILLFLFWVLAPLGIIIGLGGVIFNLSAQSSNSMLFWLVFLIFSSLAIITSVFLFLNQTRDYFSLPLAELAKEKWFGRIWQRMGVDSSAIDLDIFNNKEKIKELLRSVDMTEEEFSQIVEGEISYQMEKNRKAKFWLRENLLSAIPIGRQWAFAYTVDLDKYSVDLTMQDWSKYGHSELIGREKESRGLKQILERPTQSSLIIVGEPGVGREALVHSLAKEIRENRLGAPFADKRILELDVKKVMAENASSGRAGEVLTDLLQEASYAGNVTLFIKDIHECLNENGLDISPVLSTFLEIPAFQMIGTSSLTEFHSRVEKKDFIMKYCEKIIINEISEEDTFKVLMKKINELEDGKIVFTYQAVKQMVKLTDRYISGVPFPEKALDFLEEVILHWKNSSKGGLITETVVNEAMSAKIGVPLGEVGKEEGKKLLDLEKRLHERVIGQEFAIKQIAETIRRGRIGMGDKNKPLGSFLFLGSTGVGKTESAKALAESYFGDENRMIRLDMSEYQMPDSIDRLIGSERTGVEGYLVSKVKESPYSLLLLDEIEKAHPDVLNIFLQILDEGSVTSGFGKKISFRNLIIIATSNAGAEIIRESIKKNIKPEETQKEVINYVINQGIFRPEFLNRFEGLIFFHSLSLDDSRNVTKLLLAKYSKNLKKQENIEISFGESVVEKIIEEAYDPTFGARAIDRYIQDKIGDKVVKKVIGGEIKKGMNYVFEATEMEK